MSPFEAGVEVGVKTAGEKPPWKKPAPKGVKSQGLSDEWRDKARERAAAAGRPYPNLVDNMWASRMSKTAGSKADESSKRDTATTAAQIGTGGLLAHSAGGMVTGSKRMYHGTSNEAWKNIQQQGMTAELGGAAHGAGATVGNRHFVARSKGKVHLTRYPIIAGFFSRITGKNRGGGKVIKIDMDYDKYRSMEIDPDMRFPGPDLIRRNIASRGAVNITPEEIHGSSAGFAKRISHRLRKMPGYIAKHPLRFGAGVGIVGGGAALMAKGVKNAIKSHLNNKKKQKTNRKVES